MRLIILATLAVGLVIIGGALTIKASETEWDTWQEAVNELRDMIRPLENYAYLEQRVNELEARQYNSTNPSGGLFTFERQIVVTGLVLPGLDDEGFRLLTEEPITDVTVIAVNVADHSKVKRSVTDETGRYLFILPPGSYLLQAVGGGPHSYSYVDLTDPLLAGYHWRIPYYREG